MKFTEEEKLSVLKAMDELIRADGEIHENEVAYLEAVADSFDLNPGFMSKIESFKHEDAVEAVRSLTPEKLEYFNVLLRDLASSDSSINEQEELLLNKISDFIKEYS